MIDRRLPICPGCNRLATPKDCNGEVRWSCHDPACVVDSFVDSFNPDPRLERQPSLFDRRRTG